MANKMKPAVKFALAAGVVIGAVSLFRNEKVKKWSKENAGKLRDSSLGANVAELSDWSRDRIYELRDPESKTSRLVRVLPAGNYIQRALEVILPEQSAVERGTRKIGKKAREWSDNAQDRVERAGDKAQDWAEDAGDDAENMARKAGDKVSKFADRAGEGAHKMADRAGANAKDASRNASDAMSAATDHISEKAVDAAERVDGMQKSASEFIGSDNGKNNKDRDRVKSAS